MKINQRGTFDPIIFIIVVMVLAAGALVLQRLIGSESNSGNTQVLDRALDESRMREAFGCDRVTADARATDIYCADYELYLQHVDDDSVLDSRDFDDPRYEEARNDQANESIRSATPGGFTNFSNTQVSFDYPTKWTVNDEGSYVEILSDDFREISGTSD